MALFCVAVRRDPVSRFRFILVNYVHVFLYAISFVCRLKYSYSCFVSHFCFYVLVVVLFVFMSPKLFQAAVICLSLLFF